MGRVATTAHQKNNAKSARRPAMVKVKVIEKTMRCIGLF
jgi:hypothetical protein